MKYEYVVQQLPHKQTPPLPEPRKGSLHDQLNQDLNSVAHNGLELVSVVPDPTHERKFLFFFRRPQQ